MKSRRDPIPLGEVLKAVLNRLGMTDLDRWQRIQNEWEEVAGAPWNTQSRPLSLTNGVLVVEAVTPAAIGLLRYGVVGLRQRLCDHFGDGVVDEIQLRSPGSGRRT
ncbi:MAG: DUF721 domain-containing protein [Acidimicrobiia bacterium]|nr:DUF721 domain-containing protein [Acidimicrobiia bacterium]